MTVVNERIWFASVEMEVRNRTPVVTSVKITYFNDLYSGKTRFLCIKLRNYQSFKTYVSGNNTPRNIYITSLSVKKSNNNKRNISEFELLRYVKQSFRYFTSICQWTFLIFVSVSN